METIKRVWLLQMLRTPLLSEHDSSIPGFGITPSTIDVLAREATLVNVHPSVLRTLKILEGTLGQQSLTLEVKGQPLTIRGSSIVTSCYT